MSNTGVNILQGRTLEMGSRGESKKMVQLVSKRLKGLMAEHDITIRELSKKMSISKNSLTQKINGQREWYFDELIFITRQFGFSEVKEVFPELYNYILRAG